jgi:hypothetical protein
MLPKLVFELVGPYIYDADDPNPQALLESNDALHDALNACKNNITRHHEDRTWDRFKKITNDYELVFPGVAAHYPISRSFFKLWEVLHDFACEFDSIGGRVRAMFLAEGPGGFMESFSRFRATRSCFDDELHGITLMSRNRDIPGWKLNAMRDMRFTVHRGADGTGDLYKLDNIDHLVLTVGASSCHFITADGGFDFSGDFNNQEDTSMRLIVAEVYTAVRLQAPGGAFVLKIYDVRSPATVRLLHVLRSCYRTMRIVKPLTSRPANSEKYVVCTGFTSIQAEGMLRAVCAGVGTLDGWRVPWSFIRDVVTYNAMYISRQMAYIGHTIQLIRGSERSSLGAGAHTRHQLEHAMRWCHAYRLPLSLAAVRRHYNLMASPSATASNGST